jgi:hypothetical protein
MGMGLLVRRLLLGLMAAAVAVQGVSAATMAYCIPHDQGSASAAVARHDTPDARDARPLDVGNIQHPSEAPAQKAQAPSSSRLTTTAKIAHAKKHKCSSCSSGCFAGALLHRALVVALPDDFAAVFGSVTFPVAPFITSGPDRPPRHT